MIKGFVQIRVYFTHSYTILDAAVHSKTQLIWHMPAVVTGNVASSFTRACSTLKLCVPQSSH